MRWRQTPLPSWLLCNLYLKVYCHQAQKQHTANFTSIHHYFSLATAFCYCGCWPYDYWCYLIYLVDKHHHGPPYQPITHSTTLSHHGDIEKCFHPIMVLQHILRSLSKSWKGKWERVFTNWLGFVWVTKRQELDRAASVQLSLALTNLTAVKDH